MQENRKMRPAWGKKEEKTVRRAVASWPIYLTNRSTGRPALHGQINVNHDAEYPPTNNSMRLISARPRRGVFDREDSFRSGTCDRYFRPSQRTIWPSSRHLGRFETGCIAFVHCGSGTHDRSTDRQHAYHEPRSTRKHLIPSHQFNSTYSNECRHA